MLGYALNSVKRIQILMHRDLEDRRAALTARNDRVRKEEYPNSVPPLAVFGEDLFLVGHPVLVPLIDGGGVVHAEDVDVFDFETSAFKL